MWRLSGDGSRDLSLEEHGKHIGSKLEDAYVAAEVVGNDSQAITLRRTIKSKKLEPSGDSPLEAGQFTLTRKELLKFIACEGTTRAEQIQSLLDLREVEKVRVAIHQALNQLERRESEFDAVCRLAGMQMDNLLGLQNGTWKDRLSKINELRRFLGAVEFQELADDLTLTSGISRTPQFTGPRKSDFEILLSATEPSRHD